MANLRDIRNRISSVRNMKQITNAMKMVAAAKLRKAQLRMIGTRPYAAKMREITGRLVLSAGSRNPLLRVPEEKSRARYIVIGSDRGLCGGFNNNLFKLVEDHLHREYPEWIADGRLELICIGKKADAYFSKRGYRVVQSWPGFFDNLTYSAAMKIMDEVIRDFTSGKIDEVGIAYNEFKSVISQNRKVRRILPIDPEEMNTVKDSALPADYIYEPGVEGILDELLPRFLHMELWSALLESSAAEEGARMAAMDNATENATELEDELRLKYNQARQSAITTEISEIVSGAQALQDL